MIRSALVLGATGKSGRRLVPLLEACGLTVRAASRQSGDGHVPFDWMNPGTYFARVNSAVRMSPAMACGLEQRLWDVGDIVKLIDEYETAQS